VREGEKEKYKSRRSTRKKTRIDTQRKTGKREKTGSFGENMLRQTSKANKEKDKNGTVQKLNNFSIALNNFNEMLC
jgi:hypothetical protein